jgi:uncharacterized protein YecE (DUF72 family)
MKIVCGTSGWQYKEWKGSFYPERMKEPEMLPYYASRLTAVEVNYTFRRTPEPETFQRWREQVTSSFEFLLKMPQSVTHFRRLNNAQPQVERLLTASEPLGAQRGPLLVQLPSNMKVDQERLDSFLGTLAPGVRAALEFQHASWFTDETYETLHRHNAALCLTEKDEEAAPRVATADWGYLRLRRGDYADDALQTWLNWVRDQDWTEAAVFFKHENEARGPRFALRFLEMLSGPE